jgi:hypothetical protein
MASEIVFGTVINDSVVFTALNGEPFSAAEGFSGFVILSRGDYDLKCMTVPQVPHEELDSMIRYRLRAIYPGNLENVEIDYLEKRHGNELDVMVFIIKKNILKTYRAAAKSAKLIAFAQLIPVFHPKPNNDCCIVLEKGYSEFLIRNRRTITDSTLAPPSTSQDFVSTIETFTLHFQKPAIVTVVGPSALWHDWKTAFPADFIEQCSFVSPEALKNARIKLRGLFLEKVEHKPHGNRQVYRGIMLFLCVALFEALLYKHAVTIEHDVSVYTDKINRFEQVSIQDTMSAKKLKNLETQVLELKRTRPLDYYQFLCDIKAVFGKSILIQDLTLKDSSFQLEAQGSDPLIAMERFSENTRFHDVRLIQSTAVTNSTAKTFTVTGTYQ